MVFRHSVNDFEDIFFMLSFIFASTSRYEFLIQVKETRYTQSTFYMFLPFVGITKKGVLISGYLMFK